ncbi:MAG: hypothetical protein QW445_07240 [Candidatus Bathyarchaeia archaeon]
MNIGKLRFTKKDAPIETDLSRLYRKFGMEIPKKNLTKTAPKTITIPSCICGKIDLPEYDSSRFEKPRQHGSYICRLLHKMDKIMPWLLLASVIHLIFIMPVLWANAENLIYQQWTTYADNWLMPNYPLTYPPWERRLCNTQFENVNVYVWQYTKETKTVFVDGYLKTPASNAKTVTVKNDGLVAPFLPIPASTTVTVTANSNGYFTSNIYLPSYAVINKVAVEADNTEPLVILPNTFN